MTVADCFPAAQPGTDPRADELAELADEFRAIWRQLSRGTHLSGGTSVAQRQQFWLLGTLSKGPRRMRELAEWACTSQGSLTGIVDRLEESGFVTRVPSDTDRRVTLVSLTEIGAGEVERAKAEIAERMRSTLEPLAADERAELLRLLRKMTRCH